MLAAKQEPHICRSLVVASTRTHGNMMDIERNHRSVVSVSKARTGLIAPSLGHPLNVLFASSAFCMPPQLFSDPGKKGGTLFGEDHIFSETATGKKQE